MMRVLIAHDFYRTSAPSGEDAVVRNERALLERNGIEVVPFDRFNDDIDDDGLGNRVQLALNAAWSKATYQQISNVIRIARPTLAHFHNTFPLISPSAYAACQDNGVPVVQTLHNYRLICPGGLLTREGRPCEDCVGSNLLPALRHRCYRGSLSATGAVVWMLASNRRRHVYAGLVNRYIALTRFAAGRLIAGGLPRRRMEVKPNFLVDAPSAPGEGGGNYAIFVGRLSEEKGIRTLLEAWKHVPGLPLKILGDGPLRNELERHARQAKLPVEFLGLCSRNTVFDGVAKADLQVVPSECYEGFPMVILEAYSAGTPVVASRLGSLDEIVDDGQTGLKFEAANPVDLSRAIVALMSDRRRLASMRRRCRAVFEQKYSADDNFTRLTQIYDRAFLDFSAETRARVSHA